MKSMIIAAAFVAATALSPAHAVTVHTSAFLSNVTNFNGFESTVDGMPSNTVYSDGGIDVEYVGTGYLWNTYEYVGNAGWYMYGGGYGFTKITLTGGGSFTGIQFLAGSGFFDNQDLQYEVLNNNVVVGTGTTGPTANLYSALTATFGFSGGTFDEVRLQNLGVSGAFDPLGYEALALDNIEIDAAPGVPEPASWALMIAGFGMVGFAMRRRKVAFVA
jgi:hypothetical protein